MESNIHFASALHLRNGSSDRRSNYCMNNHRRAMPNMKNSIHFASALNFRNGSSHRRSNYCMNQHRRAMQNMESNIHFASALHFRNGSSDRRSNYCMPNRIHRKPGYPVTLNLFDHPTLMYLGLRYPIGSGNHCKNDRWKSS
jgi:hypothetical protein